MTKSLQTYNSLFKQLATNHKMINDYGWGPVYNIFTEHPAEFPYLWIEPVNTRVTSIGNGYLSEYNTFNFYVMDKINKGDENFNDTANDCDYICKTILSEIDQLQYFIDQEISIDGDITGDPVYEDQDDNVNGWKMSITFKQPMRYTPCNNPIDNYYIPVGGYPGVQNPFNYVTQAQFAEYTGVTAPSLYVTNVNLSNILNNYYTTSQTYSSTQIDILLSGVTGAQTLSEVLNVGNVMNEGQSIVSEDTNSVLVVNNSDIHIATSNTIYPNSQILVQPSEIDITTTSKLNSYNESSAYNVNYYISSNSPDQTEFVMMAGMTWNPNVDGINIYIPDSVEYPGGDMFTVPIANITNFPVYSTVHFSENLYTINGAITGITVKTFNYNLGQSYLTIENNNSVSMLAQNLTTNNYSNINLSVDTIQFSSLDEVNNSQSSVYIQPNLIQGYSVDINNNESYIIQTPTDVSLSTGDAVGNYTALELTSTNLNLTGIYTGATTHNLGIDSLGNVYLTPSATTITIGGSDTNIQFNNNGLLDGNSGFTYSSGLTYISEDMRVDGSIRSSDLYQTTCLGTSANLSKSGYYGTWVGFEAGKNNASGYGVVGIGYQALTNNTEGDENVAVGVYALFTNTSGLRNVAVGADCLYANTIGIYNVGVGYKSLYANTIGVENVAIGETTLLSNIEGNNNTAIQTGALTNNTLGNNNIGIGVIAGYSNTEGNGNIYLGYYAGFNNVTGNSNVFIGTQAGYHETGSNRLYISNGQNPLIYGEFDNQLVKIYGKLQITNVNTGTSVNNLGIDSLGNVIIGTTASTVNLSGYYTTAQTYSQAQANANFLSANTSYYTQAQANANFLSANTISTDNFGISIDGQGSVITTGLYDIYRIPYTGTITNWDIIECSPIPLTGITIINIYKSSNFYPTSGQSIFSSTNKPTLSGQTYNSLSGLSIAVAQGDYIRYSVDTNIISQKISLILKINKINYGTS